MLTKRFFAPFLSLFTLAFGVHAQAPHNWQNLNPVTDNTAGVAANAAYADLLKNMTSTTVLVAVIDGGSDPTHPDLMSHIWTNIKEIPDNGIDDDNNGYVDDIHGWDFIGGKNGDVHQDNLEITRLYKVLKLKFDGVAESAVTKEQKEDYKFYLSLKKQFEADLADAKANYEFYGKLIAPVKKVQSDLGGSVTKDKLKSYKPTDEDGKQGKQIYQNLINSGVDPADALKELQDAYDYFGTQVNYHYNIDFDPRNIVGDNYADGSEKNYGNSDVKGPDALHGSHVAGIIGAVRDNRLGMDGVADNVMIMIVRVVPDGDERDKDVANGIRYAVDNGAKIINMSFGKAYSPYKYLVDDAVKYAVAHDVLIIHAAGNDAKNTDKENNFPNDKYADGGTASTWIEVGAIQPNFNPADFSNYGKKNVDIFAPGTEIYSTVPEADYINEQGTSMASPVCAGVAAIIRSYFPELTALEVKKILMKSVTTVKQKITIPGEDKQTKLKSLCISGGVVNAYNAVKLAMELKAKK